jgi:hypothetical protein
MAIPFPFPGGEVNSINVKVSRGTFIRWQDDNSFRALTEGGRESGCDDDKVVKVPVGLAAAKRR